MRIAKEIKDAVLDVVMGRIDKNNYGMLSNYQVRPCNVFILHRSKIQITDKNYLPDEILQDGVTIGKIHHRYASRKVNGMYKTLKPKIEWCDA